MSKEYGWTPSEIKEQDWDDIQSYWQIMGVKNMLQEAEYKKSKLKYGK